MRFAFLGGKPFNHLAVSLYGTSSSSCGAVAPPQSSLNRRLTKSETRTIPKETKYGLRYNKNNYSVIIDNYSVINYNVIIESKGLDMKKANEILKKEHSKQLNWLDGQIKKSAFAIFLNPKKAIDAYEALKAESLIITEDETEKFIARYLSEAGKKKLITTLRVAETRSKAGAKLQVNITEQNKAKLDYLANKTNLSKVEIINKLIEMSDIKRLTTTEEQLEITL